jgi:hypothetical protein
VLCGCSALTAPGIVRNGRYLCVPCLQDILRSLPIGSRHAFRGQERARPWLGDHAADL